MTNLRVAKVFRQILWLIAGLIGLLPVLSFQSHALALELSGTVVDAQEQPVKDALVILIEELEPPKNYGNYISISDGKLSEYRANNTPIIRTVTAADGTFRIAVPPEVKAVSAQVLYSREKGYSVIPGDEAAKGGNMTLQPWATLSGKALRKGKPQPGTSVTAFASLTTNKKSRGTIGFIHETAKANNIGEYSFAQLPEGEVELKRYLGGPLRNERSSCMDDSIEITAGSAYKLDLDDRGIRVVGTLGLKPSTLKYIDWDKSHITISGYRLDRKAQGGEANVTCIGGPRREYYIYLNGILEKDGSYCFNNVEAGEYKITGYLVKKQYKREVTSWSGPQDESKLDITREQCAKGADVPGPTPGFSEPNLSR
ncbi:MAG: hypothetical protein ACAI35_05355 [Candidatus Methylacidiphilales bacterium]